MKLETAIRCADRAATLAWIAAAGPPAFGWRVPLCNARADLLAQFVSKNRDAPAEALYIFATREDPDAVAWRNVPRALRVAAEIFRGTLLKLLEMMDADAAAAPRPAPVRPARFRERHDERVDGYRDRHEDLVPRAARSSAAPATSVPMSAPTFVPPHVLEEARLAAEREGGGRPAKRQGRERGK